jgi:hypothetical protein
MSTALSASKRAISTTSAALALLVAGVSAAPAAAQSLYMPRNVKHAVAQGTRTLTGRPGPAYWENHARYKITVTAMPPDRRIAGTERITYVNNSPDTLPGLVIKLFQNYHKPGAPRDGGTSPDFLTSGEHIDAFSVDGHPAPWGSAGGSSSRRRGPRFFTWQPVRLPEPLMPHDSVQLALTWHYDVSKQAGREGMIDSTTYFLAYFFPRVAVYDDTNGWDMMDHSGHEFYNDFCDFDVSVQVPPGFLVWGTGTLTDAAHVLEPTYLKRYESSLSTDEIIHVATVDELARGGVTTDHPLNVWHFTAEHVPDVAFGLSDHYDWDASSVVVDPKTGRRASVQAAYNDTASDFHHMVHFGRHALYWLSRNWPGVPYPYSKTTEFEGGAGMEYPMMANDGSYPDTGMSRLVAEHEIAHTYMPFYMGIDETRYAFMDEGWATTFEYLINVADIGKAREDAFYQRFRVNRWIHNPSPLSDLPIITPADALNGVSYGDNAYGKASLGYLAMKDLLGDKLFAECLHAYMERWNGKHPSPWDFFYTFDNVSKKDLDWFWTNWYFSNGYIDLGVTGAHGSSGGYTVDLVNVGGMDAPVNLVLRYRDGSVDTVHETPAIWKADSRKTSVRVRTGKTLESVTLDGGIWMDADTTNDTWKAK